MPNRSGPGGSASLSERRCEAAPAIRPSYSQSVAPLSICDQNRASGRSKRQAHARIWTTLLCHAPIRECSAWMKRCVSYRGGRMATNTKPLKQQSIDEAASLTIITFTLALIILWLVTTAEPPGQAPTQPKAADPETSLLAEPPTADPETSPPDAPSIEALQEAPPPPAEAAAKPEMSPSTAPTVAAPAEAPLPSPESHPGGAAPAMASPEEPALTTPTPPDAASTQSQPTAPAADATAPPRKHTSNRSRRRLSAPRQATDTWKKGIGIFGQ